MAQLQYKSPRRPIPSFRELVHNVIFRPKLISTSNAMLWGVAWLIVGAIAGWYYSIVPSTIVSYTWGYASLLCHVKLSIFLGLCSTIVFAIASLRYGTTSFMDVVGRMLYARAPLTLMMVLGIWGDKVAFSTLASNPLVSFVQATSDTAIMLVPAALIMIWYLFWSYTAFYSVFKNTVLRHFDVALRYIACLLISYVVSGGILQA